MPVVKLDKLFSFFRIELLIIHYFKKGDNLVL